MVENPFLYDPFILQKGFLFRKNKFCIPKCPLRDLVVKKAHRTLVSHFDIKKNYEMLKEYFYWLKMGEDVHKVIIRRATCHMAKSQFHQGLYIPLPFP